MYEINDRPQPKPRDVEEMLLRLVLRPHTVRKILRLAEKDPYIHQFLGVAIRNPDESGDLLVEMIAALIKDRDRLLKDAETYMNTTEFLVNKIKSPMDDY